mmetsp:Transcript_18505/g.43433  ORF Transcript_18505/g.43433 Transcript_18505/m.43433 type:complete len:273 (-) Transcript_18505:473-1291(-)
MVTRPTDTLAVHCFAAVMTTWSHSVDLRCTVLQTTTLSHSRTPAGREEDCLELNHTPHSHVDLHSCPERLHGVEVFGGLGQSWRHARCEVGRIHAVARLVCDRREQAQQGPQRGLLHRRQLLQNLVVNRLRVGIRVDLLQRTASTNSRLVRQHRLGQHTEIELEKLRANIDVGCVQVWVASCVHDALHSLYVVLAACNAEDSFTVVTPSSNGCSERSDRPWHTRRCVRWLQPGSFSGHLVQIGPKHGDRPVRGQLQRLRYWWVLVECRDVPR